MGNIATNESGEENRVAANVEKTNPRRSYGTGSLIVRVDRGGREMWYGKWHTGPPGQRRPVMRRIGPKRGGAVKEGFTKPQAEEELRRLMAEVRVAPPAGELLTVEGVGARYRAHAERRGRKRSTLKNIESEVRVHLAPFFGSRSIASIRSEDVLDLVAVLEGKGLSAKSIQNILCTLSSLFSFAKAPQRRWASVNPCEGVELPAIPESEEIRFLTLEEVDALVENAREGVFQALDRAMYRTAAMTGLRQGELLALRWRDVDWTVARIRVRQNWVLGEFGTPKSKRSTRSVPMADEVGGELERLFKRSRWQGDDDLVFAHPATGEPLYKPGILRRMRKALEAAKLDGSHRFHDLRHTFGTRMAAAGVPMRTLQEWMGHRDLATTQRYADYAPSAREAEMVAAAFARATNPSTNLSEPQITADDWSRGVERDLI
jgi:integrase